MYGVSLKTEVAVGPCTTAMWLAAYIGFGLDSHNPTTLLTSLSLLPLPPQHSYIHLPHYSQSPIPPPRPQPLHWLLTLVVPHTQSTSSSSSSSSRIRDR